MKLNGVVTSLSFLLLLVSCLFSFFTLLGGARTKGVLRHFYWLEADTRGFNDAPATTRWYNYRWCEWENKHAVGCSIKKTPTAFSPKDNFGGENSEMPNTFLKKRNTYYHMSKAAWVFLLLGLIAMLVAILPQIVSIFTERAHAISATPLWLAFFFIIISACLYTATYVKARKAFHRRGRYAKLGRRNFAFIWISAALLLLNCWWSTFAAAFRVFTNYRSRKSETYYDPASDRSLDNSTAVHSGIGSAPGKKAYFDKNGKAYNGEVLVNGNDASSFERRFDNNAAYGAYNTDNTTGNPAHYKVADSTKNVKPTTTTTKDYKPNYDSYSGNSGVAGTHTTQAPQSTAYAPQGSNYQTQPTTTNSKPTNTKTYYPETSNSGNYEDGAYYGNVHKGKTLNPTEYQTNPSSSGYDKPTINSTEYNANRANNTRDYTSPKDVGIAAAQTATNAVRNL